MKFLKYPLLAAAALMALTSCSGSDSTSDDPSSSTDTEATMKAIATQYLSSTVIPTYSNLADNAEELVEALKKVKANPTDANLQAACEVFLEARAWWEKSEAFLFGPANDFGIDPHIDTWPLDVDGLKSELNNASHIASMEADDADEWAGNKLGPELLGFHGIEYIIFADGQPKSVSSIPANELTYAIAVAGDLRNKCYQLEISWAGADNVAEERAEKIEDLEWPCTVSGSGVSYSENMLNAGQAGSSYRSWTDAMQGIVDGCIDIADEVGLQKIGKPHTGEDVNYIESPYSHKSITDFYDNMVSIYNAYMGGIDGKRNESLSLHAYMKSKDSDLDARCVTAINTAMSKISTMAAPFVLNYRDSSAADAMTACSNLVDVLTEVKQALAK
ncbi:MAG: peptidase M75 [Bacteroidales bacterium]|nr:peptidase M75 [Bacteroidales bacterium]